MANFNYIVPDVVISGGSLPLQHTMEGLAQSFYDFYSSEGWMVFIFMIFPICALLGLVGLSQRLGNGDEQWGRGVSNYIWRVMLACGVLYIAPTSPAIMTGLVNNTVNLLRVGTDGFHDMDDVLSSPYIANQLSPILAETGQYNIVMREYMDGTIRHNSEKKPEIYGSDMTFDTVTGFDDGSGTGFYNVNSHRSHLADGKIPASAMRPYLKDVFVPASGAVPPTPFEMRVAPYGRALADSIMRLEDRVKSSLSAAATPADRGDAYAEIKGRWVPSFQREQALIRDTFISDYVAWMETQRRMKLYSKGNNPEEDAKLAKEHAEVSKELFADLVKMEDEANSSNGITKIPGALFDFSLIFVSVYVTFTLYILPVVLPLWASLFLLPEQMQLSQSLKKGLSLLITIWLLPVFLDLIIMVGNALIGAGADVTADISQGMFGANSSSFVGKALSIWISPAAAVGGVLIGYVVSLMGYFVAMMLIIASPVIVNKLVSGSSAFIESVVSSAQLGAGLAGTAAVAGGSAALTGGASLGMQGASSGVAAMGRGASGAGNAMGQAAQSMDQPPPMDSA